MAASAACLLWERAPRLAVPGFASLPGCVMTPVRPHSALTPRYNVTSGILLSLSGPQFPPQLNERIRWALELPPLPLPPLLLTPPSEPTLLPVFSRAAACPYRSSTLGASSSTFSSY